MPIYSNIASTLARQGPKTFAHGYAQSLVAATHSQLYASHNRPGFGLRRRASKNGPCSSYHLQNAFHNSAQSSTVMQVRPERVDGGLDAYFEAWKKTHAAGEPEREWTQFQFAKRIEWKPVPIDVETEFCNDLDVEVVEARVTDKENVIGTPDLVGRSHSADAVLGVGFPKEDEAALAKIDAAIEKEIKSRNDQAMFEAELSVVASRAPTPPLVLTLKAPLLTQSEKNFAKSNPATSVVSTPSEIQSHSYAEHLAKLSHEQRHAEIPAVFEAMLVAGIEPTATAYNALLDAVIHLSAERIHVVSKALDVYSDMLRRKILPNTSTYNKLLSLLSSRSLEISRMRKALEDKRSRFGGMEELGKFMFASSEMEFAILAEDDRLDLAIRLFDASTTYRKDRSYPSQTYHQLISACSEAGRVPEMIRIYEHMEKSEVIPLAATFPWMISGFTQTSDLSSAVECYNEYKALAIKHDKGQLEMIDRQDATLYASVVKAYVKSERMEGALQFYNRVLEAYPTDVTSLKESMVSDGFIPGLMERGMMDAALAWAEDLHGPRKIAAMSQLATRAADHGNRAVALTAFAHIPRDMYDDVSIPAIAMLALSVRQGDVGAAQSFWQVLSHPDITVNSSFIEPTAMFAVAMIGSGQVLDGLTEAEKMFSRIRSSADVSSLGYLKDEIEEGIEFIDRFMSNRGIIDPRAVMPNTFQPHFQQSPPVVLENAVDPYAASTDFKGSALIADELERGNGGRGKVSRLNEALARFRNIRGVGCHPRYITYAKLISAAAREERGSLALEIFTMARTDIPLLPQNAIVRYGWISILDAMVGACLTLGNRPLAAQYHQELLDLGAAPTANTFGLYITTLKESTKTFDEATEAVKIFYRAQSEGVEPSSFLYNALIGKLGKARRIDDCLFYFAEMRSLGIRPTSVTYGTIVNALCRVSDEKFAEELFEEMESMPNYKARPAPYNSLMQFFLTTKRNKSKVIAYYERMKSRSITPTSHTYKLLIDTHATLEPVNMGAAEAMFDIIRSTGQQPEAVHYSSLIHAKGCILHDLEGAQNVFNSVMADESIPPQACLYQALFESMVANHRVTDTEIFLQQMSRRGIGMTPYIANTLIHGWANEKKIEQAQTIYNLVGREKREPSTYEAMTRAYLAIEDRFNAQSVVEEMLSRGYPAAVSNKILELLGGGVIENAT